MLGYHYTIENVAVAVDQSTLAEQFISRSAADLYGKTNYTEWVIWWSLSGMMDVWSGDGECKVVF